MQKGRFTVLEGATLAWLVALAGTTLTGYRFGDSNHGITIPILKRFMDASLYPGDIMVATAERFPTVFYRALAAVLPDREAIAPAFFLLYLVSIAATLAGAWRIGRHFGGETAGWIAAAFAFPVKIGLAGEALYRVAFSHSHLASALTIWAIAWFLEGRRLLPLLVLSIGAYNHLLYSAYALVPLTLVVLLEAREAGRRATLQRLAAAVLPLLPLAVSLLSQARPMTQEWFLLLRERSAHHSFPSHFGGDLPDAAALLALAVLAASGLDRERRLQLGVFTGATALLFVLGTLFTELWPVKAMLQLQPHRAWRFLLLLLYGTIATGVVQGARAGGIQRAAAGFTFIVVFSPGLEPALPLAVVAQALVTSGAAPWARIAAALVLIGVTGWGDRDMSFEFLPELLRRCLNATPLRAAGLGLLIAVGVGLGLEKARGRRACAGLAAALALLALTPWTYGTLAPRWGEGAWRNVQEWARLNTPKDAVFMTPPREAGFRVFSERGIVGEWKDGTQQYFDDAFVKDWGERMQSLGGDGYPKLADERIAELARHYRARFVVLPSRRARPGLTQVHVYGSLAVYEIQP